MARRRASVKKLRSILRRARDERSPKKAAGNLLYAMREADEIRFCNGDYSEDDLNEAFNASEMIGEQFVEWARELGSTKSDMNVLIDDLLETE